MSAFEIPETVNVHIHPAQVYENDPLGAATYVDPKISYTKTRDWYYVFGNLPTMIDYELDSMQEDQKTNREILKEGECYSEGDGYSRRYLGRTPAQVRQDIETALRETNVDIQELFAMAEESNILHRASNSSEKSESEQKQIHEERLKLIGYMSWKIAGAMKRLKDMGYNFMDF